jgi:hypothetical protein
MAKRIYTAKEEGDLDAALAALRSSPAYPLIERRLKEMLEDLKESLVFNETAKVPQLQGRAQQLSETIALLNRKPK